MIKGLAITPPIIGRISIGRVVEKNGKRLPEKDDQFTLTTQVQTKDGWILHSLDERLREKAGAKLRTIPVRLLFNDPDLNLRAEYTLFDRTKGRPICSGDGESCRRVGPKGMENQTCPAPEACEFAQGACKAYARLNVLIDEEIGDNADGKSDLKTDLGTFIFRTTGFNSIRTLAARLHYYHAVSGNLLSCLTLALKLKAKSTTQSHRAPIYYADLSLREGETLESTIRAARELAQKRVDAGIDQAALDEAGRIGFANGAFEENDEDGGEIVEEFFSIEGNGQSGDGGDGTVGQGVTAGKAGLRERLARAA